ncbi:MAG: sigma-70 family RNA polymerase sigma factor [Planctomycetes bacterium]|nr:sigma-70 family RNA polymerase sigma factor [Planctomycetota bacterium]
MNDQTPGGDALQTRWSRIHTLHDQDAGDSWKWFIDRYSEAIRGMLRRHLPARFADEAEKEFWGYLFQSRALVRANPGLRFRAFLAGIVLNYARAWLRSQRRGVEFERLSDLPQSAVVVPAQAPDELWLWSRQTLVLALETMTAKFATQAVVLQWFYGLPTRDGDSSALSVAEIARRLGKSHAAIQQDLSRGRVRLRQCIEAELREQVGSEVDLQDEMRVVFGVIDRQQPGLLPDR